MDIPREIGKREFIQHTSRYLRWIETENRPLVITHHNEPVLKGYDTW